MAGLGKIFLIIGGISILLGIIFILAPHIPFLGKLPGDIVIKKDNYSFYFPIVTFLLVSILITILVNVILHFIGK
jgi:hypothetical protein